MKIHCSTSKPAAQNLFAGQNIHHIKFCCLNLKRIFAVCFLNLAVLQDHEKNSFKAQLELGLFSKVKR